VANKRNNIERARSRRMKLLFEALRLILKLGKTAPKEALLRGAVQVHEIMDPPAVCTVIAPQQLCVDP